ncbi:replication protein [Chloroflexota bacterium]
MVNPQLEDGYTQIAHEILEELAKTKLSSYEWSILVFIIRKTYGFHKKTDWISLSQIEKGTGIERPNVCRTINSLKRKNMIIRPDSKHVGFQKDHSKWNCKRVSRKMVIIQSEIDGTG